VKTTSSTDGTDSKGSRKKCQDSKQEDFDYQETSQDQERK